MTESRYEKYIVRKPAIITTDGTEALTDKIIGEGRVDTGPLVLFSPNLIKEANQIFEYGIISYTNLKAYNSLITTLSTSFRKARLFNFEFSFVFIHIETL